MKLSVLREIMERLPKHINPQDSQQWAEFLRQIGLEPGNIYQELEMSSEYVDSHQDISVSNSQVELHSHSFYELLWCCSAGGVEYLVGTERYRLQRGDIVFIPPGISHRPLIPENRSEPYRRYVIWISEAFFAHFVSVDSNTAWQKLHLPGMLRTVNTRTEELGELFHRGVQEAEQRKPGWENMLLGNTMMLLVQLQRAAGEKTAWYPKAEKPELLDRIMAYVEENYSEPINIGDMAKHFFVSSSTVSHLFQQKMNVSFYRYVTQRRLIAAKIRISQGENLQDVAVNTGFQDYSGFYRAFKQAFGISPRQYRELQEGVK